MRFYVNVNGTLAEIGDGKSAYELAVYYGYTGTEQEWLESLHGKDGSTVTLDTSTKHWFIDGVDTGIFAEGISPTATVEKVGNVVTITITDKNGTTTATIKDGEGSEAGEVNVIESISVNGTPISVDVNKNVDITVPDAYDDTALVQRVTDIESDYAKTSEIPNKVSQLENDSNYLSSIPEEYVTETELEAKGYLTEHQDISGKVDKVEGKSLISDTEITRLASVDNYDDTDIRAELANKADITAIPTVDVTKSYVDTELAKKADTNHTHTTVNGHTVESDVPVDAKFTDTVYDDTSIKAEIAKKADVTSIPSKVSDLENDSNYLSSIPEEYVTETELEAKGYLTEHQDISELVNKSHNHDNKSVIDKFSVSDSGTLLFDGNEIKGSSTTTGSDGKSAYEIAVDNGFVGTETEWLESLKGSDGTTPHIDSTTKHWFVGDADTGILAQGKDGVDGKSITSVTRDENENIIVTFSDGTTQNIGKLSVDIQGDFLTSSGIGNLRYYNNTFQYYNKSTSTWVDIEATTDNKLIVDLAPQPMQKMQLLSDIDNKCYKIVFKEPEDTIVNGQLLVAVEGIKFVRKLNSAPTDINDGELVLDYTRRNFGKYGHKIYLDTNFSPVAGENWYYKAFPYSSNGMISNSSANVANCIFKDYYLYGFKLDQSESDPASMITYLDDCDNVYFEPAYMDYNTNSFNYGDWADAWFIKNLKPCMLKYDGTVGYELDKNDYSKKVDGTASDIANTSYGGNAMVGIPKVYWKVVDNGDNTANIYICDKKIDSDFHCWSHIDNNGNEIDYCYLSAFDGCNINSTLRSISGQSPMTNQTGTTEINYAKSNNIGSDVIWYTGLFNDWMLINILLFLIGKSTDSQKTFGTGNNNTYVSTSNTGVKKSGTMNTKGLFWGSNDNASGVKVFGIENFYGNVWKRIGGWINNKGTQKIKMTYGQSDGSTVDGYNTDGAGYIVIGNSTPIGTSRGYISKVLFNENGLIPTTVNGSQTTYYCDGLFFNNSQIDYALVGGRSDAGYLVGAFCSNLALLVSYCGWGGGAALSCKPLA